MTVRHESKAAVPPHWQAEMHFRFPYYRTPKIASADAAICVTRNLPTGPAGTVGRSQNTTPASPLPSTTDSRKRALRASRSSLAMTSTARRVRPEASAAASCGRSARFALHLLKLRHHLAAGLGNVGRDGLALRLKAKPGSALAVGRDPEIADKTAAGRGHGRSLGGVYHFGKRSFDRVIHPLS